MSFYDPLIEKNLVPDFLLRIGIRNLLEQRLKDEVKGNLEEQHTYLMNFISELKKSPIAVNTRDANEQHYEVPTEFYLKALGKNLKYSCAYYDEGVHSLDVAEERMLALTCERAELKDGMKILELGCGWGSLSLWMASHYPNAQITAVSNSTTQKEHIDEQAEKRGIKNLTIITSDMNVFEIDQKFDRIVSVEMFEHMRNYQKLMEKISHFLVDDGKMFIHIFTHKYFSYLFEVKDANDWMSKYFFSGGIMPSDHLLLYFNDHFKIEKHWRVNGKHYQKTSEDWLKNMDNAKSELMPIFEKHYGKKEAVKWWSYWRIFFLACAELWGYKNGDEWFVSHYLFNKVVH